VSTIYFLAFFKLNLIPIGNLADYSNVIKQIDMYLSDRLVVYLQLLLDRSWGECYNTKESDECECSSQGHHHLQQRERCYLSTGKIGYLSTGKIGYLFTGKIGYLFTGKIGYLSTGKIGYLFIGKIGYLSTGKIGYISTGKIDYLSTGKIDYLSTGKIDYLSTTISRSHLFFLVL